MIVNLAHDDDDDDDGVPVNSVTGQRHSNKSFSRQEDFTCSLNFFVCVSFKD